MQLNGKTALVFGAGGGLGGAIARSLASEGVGVAAADIDDIAAAKTADGIVSAGGQAISIGWDIADLSVIDARLAVIAKAFGPVDILVNNTGGPPPTPASGQTAESTTSIPVGRYGRPQEYGDTVAFLASQRASYITGSVIRIDGGLIQSI
ncbi:SDR family oxidoreductase [Rhizobium mesosinicum]|uniref:SDR family oxidoreductase n=2 Tax=Rhizobium mesosinicum TaxID=335017 RepID=A0ABS7H247_9HYPH|nr:SDR family oxidoreductase [Rhizobium mesosinicum]MBW9056345.1 SDR family oxidoreductase [Rhizobium mesosinicum]